LDNKENASNLLKDLQKFIDKAVSKGLVKQNTADREKKRLTEKVKNMK
jgi:ribosomal protein S20